MLFSRLPNEGNSEGSNADLKRKSTIKASISYFLKINPDQKLVKLINRIKPLQFDKYFPCTIETYIFRSLLNKGFLPVTTEADGIELFCRIPSCRLSWDGGCWLGPNPLENPPPTAELKLETAETGPGPPGGPTNDDPIEVGVIRPPPTAELKPMVPGFAA